MAGFASTHEGDRVEEIVAGTTKRWPPKDGGPDERNRLHFYVLGKKRDAEGVLSYRVAVRSLDGAGPASRGVEASEVDPSPASPCRVAIHRFRVTNTGQAED